MKRTKKQTYAVAYCRNDNNNVQGVSIDTQLKAINEYAQTHNIVILKIYCDKADSETAITNYKQFQQMIADAKEGEFTEVIVYKKGYFCKSRYHSYGYRFELKKHGVKVVSATECINENPWEQFIETLLAVLADFQKRCQGEYDLVEEINE